MIQKKIMSYYSGLKIVNKKKNTKLNVIRSPYLEREKIY